MKKIFTLAALLLFILPAFAQVQNLRDLSRGQIVGSDIVYNNDGSDVYGYFLLYKFNQKSRDVYDMEYVLLDKNLNKITSGTFTEGVYKKFLGETEVKLYYASKIQNQLVFCIYDKADIKEIVKRLSGLNTEADLVNFRYHTLDLNDFSLSKEFKVVDGKKKESEYAAGDKLKKKDFDDAQKLYPTHGGGLILFGQSDRKKPKLVSRNRLRKYYGGIKQFSYVNPQMKTLWTGKINRDKNNLGHYFYRASDASVLVLERKNLEKKPESYSDFEIFDSKTGKRIREFINKDPDYLLKAFKVALTPNEIVIYNRLFPKKEFLYRTRKQLGYSRVVLDKKTGEELARNTVLWEAFKPHLDVKNKSGKIAHYGNIYIEDFVPMKDGSTVAIAEGYKFGIRPKVLDLFVMKFDKDFKLTYFHKTPKKKMKYKGQDVVYWGELLYKYGMFDYLYSQQLDEDGNYVFLYKNNDKEGGAGKRRRHPEWLLGIVTYVDGDFEYNELKLTKDDAETIPVKAKNGSILLQEVSDDGNAQLRLEQIHY